MGIASRCYVERFESYQHEADKRIGIPWLQQFRSLVPKPFQYHHPHRTGQLFWCDFVILVWCWSLLHKGKTMGQTCGYGGWNRGATIPRDQIYSQFGCKTCDP